MKPRYQVSKRAIELIKRFEGFRASAARLTDGRYTIGYGHTRTARAGGKIEERDGQALLIYDLIEVTGAINDLVFTPLTQNQFDALVCFAFNVGVENFRHSSVLRRVNEGNLLQAAAALEIWRRSDFEGERIVVDALIRRRAAEKALFLTPADGWVPAPSPVVPPRIDYEAVASDSRDEAVRLETPLTGDIAQAQAVEGESEPAPSLEPESPVTAAVDAVTARLQQLAAEPPPEEAAPAPETELVLDGEPGADPVDRLETTPSVEEASDEPSLFGDENILPIMAEAKAEAQADEPAPSVGETAAPEAEADTVQSLPLNFDSDPQAAVEAPIAQPAERFGRREPTAYFGEDDSSYASARVKPAKPKLLPLGLLFVAGLAALAFALVWGLSTSSESGPLGPMVISWAAGLVGIGCMIAAFYLFATRLGGED